MVPRPLNDEEIRYILVEIDKSEEITITTWEAEFIDSAVYQQNGPWTVEQRALAAHIAEKHRQQI